MSGATFDLGKLDERTLEIAVTSAPGHQFQVVGGKVSVSHSTPLPAWLLEEIAVAAGVANGECKVPTGEDFLAYRKQVESAKTELQVAMGANPFARGKHYNITKQVELRRDRPDLAKRLQDAAR